VWLWFRFQPQRSFVLALGHDEEVGGTFGAAEMAKRLKAENGGKGELAFVLDEGGVVMVEGIAPFTRKPVAVIGTAEKVAPPLSVECPQK
jgi:carboxypeptidase PM20D1